MTYSNVNAASVPFSIEAETGLLAACFFDAPNVVAHCIDSGITPRDFYDPKHATLYDLVLNLYRRDLPVEVSVAAEELTATKQLDQIGGYPILMQVSNAQPTTALANYYIKRVADHAKRRALIAVMHECAVALLDPATSTEELTGQIQTRLQASAIVTGSREMGWDSLLSFDPKNDPDCLMGKRFLSRTGGACIVAPSGVGKSVQAIQLAACAALGRAFFGLQMAFAMRVLYVQAEDDLGDVGEAVQGFLGEYGIADADLAHLRSRLRIERWNDAAGDKFLARLRAHHSRHPFDLVIINPLFSFCGCGVSDQEKMSAFLRNGLNPILNDTGAAAILVDHTNKPKEDDKAPAGAEEQRYLGSGSAELTNWARAYITLQQVKAAGSNVYKMSFAKRGHRAGLVDNEGKPTTSVLIEHSPRGLCWLPSDWTQDKGEGGKFTPKFDLARALKVYNAKLGWGENEQAIALEQNCSRKTVYRYKQSILDTVS